MAYYFRRGSVMVDHHACNGWEVLNLFVKCSDAHLHCRTIPYYHEKHGDGGLQCSCRPCAYACTLSLEYGKSICVALTQRFHGYRF